MTKTANGNRSQSRSDMDYKSLTEKQRKGFLIREILDYLQKCGGQAERSVIREWLLDKYEGIAQAAEVVKISKKTGAEWHPFAYSFNFAFKYLMMAGYITYSRTSPTITLTTEGMGVDLNIFDAERDVIDVVNKTWASSNSKEGTDGDLSHEDANIEVNKIDDYEEEFKARLLSAIAKMSPKKFEMFSRALLSKMGVEFTDIGTQISNDGGIDGYGYCRTDDFRTSRVVIQCKRWQGSVGSVEIDQFLGAMNKFRADYGIFITNSRYTSSARDAARAGMPVTLIDGDELVRLVKKYQLYLIPVSTYILGNFYEAE